MKQKITNTLAVFSLSAVLLPNVASADNSDDWKVGLSIYGWFPDISGSTVFPAGSGEDSGFEVPVDNILDSFQFAFLGSFDARKGHAGLFTDAVYMDLGNTNKVINEGTIGGTDIPYDAEAHVGFDMKSLVWTTAGYFRVLEEEGKTFDMLAGVRYVDIEQSLDWSFSGNIGDIPLPGREGNEKVSADYWDAIIGMRGRFALGGGGWYLPYYADIGAGGSDLTWQVAGGIGYAFDWGELAAVWRILSYDLPSGKPIKDLEMSGPEMGVVFRW
jgi:hypothetical protein